MLKHQPDEEPIQRDLFEEDAGDPVWLRCVRWLFICALVALVVVGAGKAVFGAEPIEVGKPFNVNGFPACHTEQARDEILRVWTEDGEVAAANVVREKFRERLCGLADGVFVVTKVTDTRQLTMGGETTLVFVVVAEHYFHGHLMGLVYTFTKTPVLQGSPV